MSIDWDEIAAVAARVATLATDVRVEAALARTDASTAASSQRRTVRHVERLEVDVTMLVAALGIRVTP